MRAILLGALGAGLAVALLEFLASAAKLPYGLIPFVTSIVLVIGAPDLPAAQPRALIGGHVVSALAGFVALWVCGPGAVGAAVGVGLAVLAMQLTRTFHPPAGINPFLIANGGLGLSFLLLPVAAGAVVLAAFAWGWRWFGGWTLRR